MSPRTLVNKTDAEVQKAETVQAAVLLVEKVVVMFSREAGS